jgi:hypothetical protein
MSLFSTKSKTSSPVRQLFPNGTPKIGSTAEPRSDASVNSQGYQLGTSDLLISGNQGNAMDDAGRGD